MINEIVGRRDSQRAARDLIGGWVATRGDYDWIVEDKLGDELDCICAR